jgi:hypothetical protein
MHGVSSPIPGQPRFEIYRAKACIVEVTESATAMKSSYSTVATGRPLMLHTEVSDNIWYVAAATTSAVSWHRSGAPKPLLPPARTPFACILAKRNSRGKTSLDASKKRLSISSVAYQSSRPPLHRCVRCPLLSTVNYTTVRPLTLDCNFKAAFAG